jgi:hypothetical protein
MRATSPGPRTGSSRPSRKTTRRADRPRACPRRLIDEHAEIRRRAKALGEHPDHTSAAELGELPLRPRPFEERELFPLLEAALTPPSSRRSTAGCVREGHDSLV